MSDPDQHYILDMGVETDGWAQQLRTVPRGRSGSDSRRGGLATTGTLAVFLFVAIERMGIPFPG